MADRRGPKGLLTIGFTFLLLGYMGIRTIYNMGVPEDGELPAWRFYALVLCSFLTGVGGNGGLCSSLNTASKSFTDRTVRTTAQNGVLNY
jgi:MFS family permease